MRRYVVIFTLLVLVLAACKVESNVILDIAEDGSAVVGTEIGFDEEFRNLIEQSGGSVDDIVSEIPDFGEGDVETIQRTEGDMTFFGFNVAVDDISTFDLSGSGGDLLSSFSAFSYEYDDSSATLEATIDSSGLGDTGDLPIDPDTITGDLFSANLIVMMPGNVVEHNADEVRSDGSLVWSLPLNGSKSVEATSEFGAGASSWLLWLLIGLLAIGVVAVVAVTIMSRRGREEAAVVAAAAASESTPPPADDAEPSGDTADTEDPKTLELDIEPIEKPEPSEE